LAEANGGWWLHHIEYLLATQKAQATGATEMKVSASPDGPPAKELRRKEALV